MLSRYYKLNNYKNKCSIQCTAWIIKIGYYLYLNVLWQATVWVVFFFPLMLNQKYMSSFILFNLGTIGLFIYSKIWTKFNVFQLYRQCFYFHWNLIFFFLWFTKRIKTDFFFLYHAGLTKNIAKLFWEMLIL